jgi:hypothetical protein
MSTADAPEVMREVVRDLYTPAIVSQHPSTGGVRLREVLAALRSIYRGLPPESFAEGLTVFASIDPLLRPHKPSDARKMTVRQLAGTQWQGATIQVLPNRDLLAWEGEPPDLEELSEVAVVYIWRPGVEAFVVGSEQKIVPNPNGYPSALASPGFFLLEDALAHYQEHMARRSSCHILAGVWHDSERLLFANKPERRMRQSLVQHLRCVLRDHAEIREEQNVTETRPIDVKVTWSNTELLSLIEIKWLGKSVNKDGTAISKEFSAPSRTDEGARQLIEYLEGNLVEAPTKPCKGYLVVYDGRRRGVTTVPPGTVSSKGAWDYESSEISWLIEAVANKDFAAPRRFFLEPAISYPKADE